MGYQSFLHTFLSFPVSYQRNHRLIVCSLLIFSVHILFFNGGLDIFFTSPVVTGIPTVHRPGLPSPPAKRVVLIVVDGLAAQTLYRRRLKATPYLRQIIRERGAWGISVARTPTLSRSGHLSLLSGVYELMHGLSRPPTENDFDSVANRSSAAFLYGEGEVVNLFSHHSQKRVKIFSYPDDLNDFSMADPTLLDHWVFRRLHEVLSNRSQVMPKSGLFFMTHLLGVDTFSHSHTSDASKLEPLLTKVDAGVAQTEAHFRKVFHDNQTAFILTADHGMSPWSAHGAGDSKEEVTTPFLAWGAGIRRQTGRVNVAQVDVCPLIAALLNLDFPVHSVGRVPSALLNVSAAARRDIMRANAAQVTEQFLQLRRTVKKRVWLFNEFRMNPADIQREMELAKSSAKHKAVEIYEQLIQAVVEGVYHFHKHPNTFRLPCLVAIFILFLFACILSFLRAPNSQEGSVPLAEISVFLGFLSLVALFLIADGRGPRDCIYVLLLVYFAWGVYRNCAVLRCLSPTNAIILIGLVLTCELIVVAVTDRRVFAVVLFAHALCDLHFTESDVRGCLSARLFRGGVLLVALFTFLPKGWPLCFPLVYVGPCLTVVIAASHLRRHQRSVAVLLFLQLCMIAIACWNHFRTHSSILAGRGMPLGATITTKAILLLAPVAVGLVSRRANGHVTLLSLWLSITAAFTPFCLFLESVFLFIFFLTLGAWVSLHRGFTVPYYLYPWSDTAYDAKPEMTMRTAYFGLCFYMYMYASCYGIGNEATISSYDPRMVLCFQGVFDLNVMTMVVFLKNTLPLTAVAGHFLLLLHDVNRLQILRLVVIFSGLVSLHLFFLIREDNQWLLVATQVNHFTCNLLYMAFLFIIFPLVALLFPQSESAKAKNVEYVEP